MEHVSGGDMFAYMSHRGRFPEHEAIGYFRQILSGIEFLHSFHICHRDLKLENILMDGHGQVMIADFGLSIRSNGKKVEDYAGSLQYTAPEIVKSEEAYDGTLSDIWSLGVVLLTLLAGWMPFDDGNDTDEKLKDAICSVSYTMPEELSDLVKDLIWSMIQYNPEDRLTIQEIWNHAVVAKYPNKDKHGIETDRFQMPFAKVDLLGPLVDDVRQLNQESLTYLSILWQRTTKQIQGYLMTDRYVV